MTANMNFGPEWMRGGLPQRSNTMDSQSTQSTLSPTLTASLSSSKDNEFGSTSQDNPYRYSKDFMLGLYRPMDVPSQFDKLPFVAVDEPISPLAFIDLTDDEKKLLSGPVHSEPARRTMANNEKGNSGGSGQRYHRVATDFHSAENGSSRPMNRSKGRPGMENRRETSPDFDGMKNGDGQSTGNDNISWSGGRDAFGSWETRNAGGAFASGLEKGWANRPDDNEAVPASWSQQGAGGENGLAFKTDGSNSTFGGGGSAFDAPTPGDLSSSSSSSPGKHPNQYKWFYRDPSSNVQGPFNAQEMQDWYKAGFFGPTLWIRREDHDQFEPLAALVIKVGSEDIFTTPIPQKKDPCNPLGNMSSFRPISDPFGRVSNSGPLFGTGAGAGNGGLSSPSLASPGGFFNNNNNQGADILSPGIGKYNPFGSHLNQGSASNPGTPSLPLASPFGNNDANIFGASLLAREPSSPWGDRSATPSWMNNSQSDLFGTTFQRQQQQPQQQQQQHQHQQFYYQQQQQQQQHMQSMMNPLLQQRGTRHAFGGEPVDSQQQVANVLQQRQHAMTNQPFQLQQDMSVLSDQPVQQHGLGQSQVLEQLSNHASPVIRPAALTGWGSGPGTPVATDAPSSPWGSIVSPAIPQKMSDELQSKAPGQQSPRSHLSPQLQHVSLPPGPSKTSPLMDAGEDLSNDTTVAMTTTSRAKKANNIQETIAHQQLSTPPSVEAIKSSLKKVSLHAIQQEQEDQRKQKEETRQRQLEKENAHRQQLEQEAEDLMRSKKAASQPTNNTTKEQPAVPLTFKAKAVSLLDIQAEEEKKQKELKKQAKANNKVAAASLLQQQQQNMNTAKSGWNVSGSGWTNESYKGPSLREIQELEAKEAQRKKEMEQRSSASQQMYSSHSLNSTSTTMSWGVVTQSKATSVSNSTSPSTSSAPAWGSSSAPKKKTFFEIQQEEEVAMQKKILKQQQQTLVNKSGYSSVASTAADDDTWTTVQPKPKQAPADSSSTVPRTTSNSGWDVVGAPKKTLVLNQASSVASRPMVVSQQRKTTEPKGPSEGFKLWCKQSLRDLSPGVNADEILKMILSFPADNSVSEIIQDIIYANSTSMDGRRFATEFMKRRRADLSNNGNAAPVAAASFATSLSTTANSGADDDSFQVVNKKGKKNKAM
ncbi:hypothetical protein BCR42DRAFT_404088 [Absidia repens]|uniref:GYF domain-containing protein n=1 Tax=Absidia repens TaxID=90262 RepID=A0A1X2IVQ4_9FUNG|nr:hypothetical protein BCR42DRAFT_404088 [Absidia repens]